jgi:hypothetical protein
MTIEIPSDLNPTLEALRKHYQGIIEYAHSQLAHAEALLGGSVVSLTPLSVESAIAPVVAIPVDDAPIESKIETPIIPKRKVKAPIATFSPPAEPVSKPKPIPKVKVKPIPKEAKSSLKPRDILDLKPQYQGKAILVVLGEVLKEREGEAVLTADIVSELHGKLAPDLFKVAKERLGKSLSKGKIDGLWDGVPGKTGFYTHSIRTLQQ